MKILVTGGAGFIGSHLVDRLVEEGHEVIVIDDLSSGNRENVNSKAMLIIRDIVDDVEDVFKEGIDYVFHLAAQMNVRVSLDNPEKDAKINILGGLNIIKNCVRYNVKKMIFSSTGGAIYSSKAEIPCDENSEAKPESPYGLAKLTIENYLRIMESTRGLNYCALRYANVYGPRQNAKGEAGVVSIFISNFLNGRESVVFGDGEQTRDYVFVNDVVDANIIAMEKNLKGAFNVGTGIEVSVNEIANKINKLMKDSGKIIHGKAVIGELRRNALDANKLKSEGWSLNNDLDEGLKKTVEWFKKNLF
ncbi:UDP-glucose 4-epimerase [Candidatus Pacearchaeota archaeon CG10_big_fil_rev_8_21_14_0_10_34_76]|nr:MAG: UDP-glucose 4-epimerase [Candidatus Pacearchaeota archaeon CG10_big_fil_rev_8_21_14_0_10_34_76]